MAQDHVIFVIFGGIIWPRPPSPRAILWVFDFPSTRFRPAPQPLPVDTAVVSFEFSLRFG